MDTETTRLFFNSVYVCEAFVEVLLVFIESSLAYGQTDKTIVVNTLLECERRQNQCRIRRTHVLSVLSQDTSWPLISHKVFPVHVMEAYGKWKYSSTNSLPRRRIDLNGRPRTPVTLHQGKILSVVTDGGWLRTRASLDP